MREVPLTLQSKLLADKIVIYSKNNCPFCVRAKNLLTQKGMAEAIVDRNVQAHPEKSDDLMKDMSELSNGAKTFPQIFIGFLHVGGADDLLALDEKGELLGLLEKIAI